MNEEYFEWLLNKAGVGDAENGYRMLCSVLHDTQFYPLNEMDENRWEDGMRYRMDFGSAEELDEILGGCTMLELTLSMAEKMQYENQDSLYDAEIGKWFEELIGNLGLDVYTDREMMNNESAYFEISDILDRVIFRRYGWNGEGGFFPLRNPSEDQREVELAIQMNNYLLENYDIFGGQR